MNQNQTANLDKDITANTECLFILKDELLEMYENKKKEADNMMKHSLIEAAHLYGEADALKKLIDRVSCLL